MANTIRVPMITIEPFDLKKSWPFEQEHHLVIRADSRPYGMLFSGVWSPRAVEPKGLVVACLDYESAGLYMYVCHLLAPLFSCLLMETDRARAGALMNSTACLASYLQQHTNQVSVDMFEAQHAGYEVSLMAKEGR